ncbi:hypothetical protein ACOI9H_04890 [Corynebacterium striatum]
MDGFINFAIGSSEFANDLKIYATLIEPLVQIAKGASQLIGMFV